MNCTQCGVEITVMKEHQRYRFRKVGRIFCTTKCGMTYRERFRTDAWKPRSNKRRIAIPPAPPPCTECGLPADLSGHRLPQWKHTGRAYCGLECSKRYRARRSSETMSRTNLQYASERMTARNPMKRPEIRKKVSESLRGINHKPPIQGGNGKDLPLAEKFLFTLFGSMGFVPQLAIRTYQKRGNALGVPPTYKPDLGNPEMKIALEADGNSHNALHRQEQDRRKNAFLSGLGWTVLRFTNRQILERPEEVVQTVLSTILRLKTSTLTLPTA